MLIVLMLSSEHHLHVGGFAFEDAHPVFSSLLGRRSGHARTLAQARTDDEKLACGAVLQHGLIIRPGKPVAEDKLPGCEASSISDPRSLRPTHSVREGAPDTHTL
jgi:hypothetical protein